MYLNYLSRTLLALILSVLLDLPGSIYAQAQNNESRKPEQAQNSPETKPEVGYMAPDFELIDLEGKSIILSSLRGKVVVLNFWTLWCRYCKLELYDLEKFYNQYKDRGLEMLMVNTGKGDRKEKIEEFIKERGYSFKVLLDRERCVSEDYRISVIPRTLIVGKDGIIRKKIRGMIDNNTFEKELEKVTME